ncbi:flagellin N-terminal-like domain-containing protein [Natronoarchaeum philippinense]|uniref:Flagellin N-terminal-like domain-containing protein n=1 Tax=Natronoarchaeum philippinense TaxID=558529 RepID=A0A285NS97_NATPI|nr:type IV pilin N-terminal domain-containing protein [Natronoarchaeum philippinense]SNZ12394.1 flagellin N-terminal-like domain-containing protein [Natronoarchaeum philippinense]
MNLKELFTDDDAVSPVIGVILMVAITVILAAVIGAFVLDIGGSQESAPQVQWDWSDDAGANEVTLSHGGGDTVNNPGQISVTGDATEQTLGSSGIGGSFADSITAGDSEVVPGTSGGSTGTITLIWESSDGSQSTELSSHDYDLT